MSEENFRKITFFGAAGTVTGSKFLVETSATRILVDCGLFQGLKKLRLKNWDKLPFDPKSLDAVVLTHAHIDHSGSLPLLVREGYSGPIFCTEPTKDLCSILLPDCGRIAEEDASYANRMRFSKHSPALPLYTENDAFKALSRLTPQACNQVFQVNGCNISFKPVGHILGAAGVTLSCRDKSLVFSGDLGRYNDLIEHAPSDPNPGNLLILESTYGDRMHSPEDPIAALGELAKRVIDRNGVLVIPSFAVGRAQILMYCLHKAIEKGLMPRVPIYLNSPMASRVTDLYRKHSSWHRLSEQECDATFSRIHFVGSVEESKALNRKSGPMIIISASGMITGGRILHHIKHFGQSPENAILLPGYQAAGTRGSSLVRGERRLKIHGKYIPIEAEVVHWDTLSAHADRTDLLRWAGAATPRPQGIFLVHGEPHASDQLRCHIQDQLHVKVTIPSESSSYDLQEEFGSG